MNLDPRSVFVTGGSGFIGRHVVRGLSNQGYSVRVLARRAPQGLDASVEVVSGDLTRPESFAPALQGVSAVVHAALTDGLATDFRRQDCFSLPVDRKLEPALPVTLLH